MKNLILFLALCFGFNAFSQIFEPIKWETSVEKISDSEYKLITKASIDTGWHLYSQNVPEDGPIPTTFTFDDADGTIQILGKTIEDEGHTVDDPVFEMKITYFEDHATFEQKIKLSESKATVNGTVEFMVCDDKRCLPPTEVDLVFNIDPLKKKGMR